MSTVADVLPYMQDWLDARAALAPVTAAWVAAKNAQVSARATVTTRVGAGDSAVTMTSQIQAYVTAHAAYIAQDSLQQAQAAVVLAKYTLFEQMVELLATGQTVPPFPVPVP